MESGGGKGALKFCSHENTTTSTDPTNLLVGSSSDALCNRVRSCIAHVSSFQSGLRGNTIAVLYCTMVNYAGVLQWRPHVTNSLSYLQSNLHLIGKSFPREGVGSGDETFFAQ